MHACAINNLLVGIMIAVHAYSKKRESLYIYPRNMPAIYGNCYKTCNGFVHGSKPALQIIFPIVRVAFLTVNGSL